MDELKIKQYTDIVKNKFLLLKKMFKNEFEPMSTLNADIKDQNKVGGFHAGILETTSKKIEYVYYKNLNKLVSRLRLLLNSQKAGNDIHSIEIESILSELSHQAIIKRNTYKKSKKNLTNSHNKDNRKDASS